MPIFSGGGGGGGVENVSAVVYTAGDTAGYASGTVVPFDTVDYDPHGFFDAANNRFVIPAALDGAYLFTAKVSVAPTVSLTQLTAVLNFAAEPNLTSPGAQTQVPATTAWSMQIIGQGQFIAGDAVDVRVTLTGVASCTLVAQCQFSVVRLGLAA